MSVALLTLGLVLSSAPAPRAITVPDEVLVDQDGRSVRLPELMKGKTVAVNFVFSTCTTICSPMSAVFGRLQEQVGPRLGKDVALISISLDPRTDTPERLRAYADKFGRRPGWTFLTGASEKVNRVLKAMGGYAANKEEHAPFALVGHPDAGLWERVAGLGTADALAKRIDAVSRQAARAALPIASAAESDAVARRYFTDTVLVDHQGRRHRFYTDLIRGRRVLINFAFASCRTACSPITANLARVQRLLGERVGRDVRMITITVDPERDTPEKLGEFARKFGAGPGWYFLSGDVPHVRAVLRKLGGYTEDPEQHLTSVLIGDAGTGHWVKALAMSPPENLARTVEAINDPVR